jgi:hypothetical protein
MDINESTFNASVWTRRPFYSIVGEMLDMNVIPMFQTLFHISNIEGDLRTVIESNDNYDEIGWVPVWGLHGSYPAGQEHFLKELAELIFGSNRIINWHVNHITSHLNNSNVLPPPIINLTTITWQCGDCEYKFETRVDSGSDSDSDSNSQNQNNEHTELIWWFSKTYIENNLVDSFNAQVGLRSMFNTLEGFHMRISMLENNRRL